MDEAIRVEGVRKCYNVGEQTVRALDGVDLSISRNEYVAIMGPSGSGKSTIMNILGCMDIPTEGKYFLDGTDTGDMDEDELAGVRSSKIGFVFQSFNLLPRYDAVENVALPLVYRGVPKKERIIAAEKMLSMVGLSERMHHKPSELSGGQRQRVAIARALIGKPTIILADEPTGNLDTRTSVDIMRLLGRIHKQGNTIILVTHEEDIARYAHRIVRLVDGRIASDEINDRITE